MLAFSTRVSQHFPFMQPVLEFFTGLTDNCVQLVDARKTD